MTREERIEQEREEFNDWKSSICSQNFIRTLIRNINDSLILNF